MNIYQPSRIRKAAVITAAALTMLSASMSTADASEPLAKVDRTVHVQLAETAPKHAGGTLTPSGTHIYLPAVVTPQSNSTKVMLFVQKGV